MSPQETPGAPSLEELDALRRCALEREHGGPPQGHEPSPAEGEVSGRLGCWAWDVHADRVSCSVELCQIHGLPQERFTGSYADYLTHVHQDDRERVRAALAAALRERRPFVLNKRAVRPDGAVRLLRNTAWVDPDEAGVPVRLLGVCEDVTEQRRRWEQAHRAQKLEAVARLAGGVAHEFNNLLTALGGHAELLLDSLPAEGPLAEHAHAILRAAERAAGLTRQLLTLAGREAAAPASLDLNAVVAGAEGALRRLLGDGVALALRLGSGLWRVRADAAQAEEVLLHLARNARDAMAAGGQFTVETRNFEGVGPVGPQVLLAVSDTGCGMDAATRGRIFEPFFTTKEVGQGTGLGLAVVHGIVTASGGHLEVESEPGCGACFKVYLPRLEVTAVEPVPHPAAPPRGETVLLVEDEGMVRGLARRILQMHGYTVLEAAHGAEALEVAGRHAGPIHLLLTDVVMPQMGGRQLADRLAPARPGMKVLFMSGYIDDAVVRHGVFAAERAFLPKPFAPDALARKVREVLDH